MGKEQDLLNAGKTGNVSQIEKILGQRGKKSGLHSIIVRNTNPNYQDEMGYTPLHYASVNGHRAAVELLLKYDASANIPDHSENYPLHLAAFSGHADVCRVLINSGPSVAKVNEQNGTEDTAMHSAAQSKSCQVVAVLLENHADPFIRNCRKESPLDLAAQYGRMENVKLLLSYHPHLLQNNVKTHSPLHLAARNGHIEVVSNLLGCGMSVNFQCDTGTALHEAALFGKLDVCTFLLQCDVDITIKDKNHMTVMDLLMNHPSSKTKEISGLIYNYTQTKGRPKTPKQSSHSFKEQQLSLTPPPATRASTISYRSSNYDDIPGHRLSRRDTCTYDQVPPHAPSQYDSVPAPEATGDRSTYAEARHDTPQNIIQPSNVSGYSYLLAAGEPTTTTPILTPKNVKDGYTMLGIPVPRGHIYASGEEYTTVRSEGSPKNISGSPKSSMMDKQRFPSGGRQGDPLPCQDMMSAQNVAYFQIEPHNNPEPQSPTTASNSIPDYEFVPRQPNQRAVDISMYEVPPAPQLRQQPTQPEGDYGLVGSVFTKPLKPVREHKQEVAVNPPTVASSPVYEVPPTAASPSVYEVPPTAASPSVYEVPPTAASPPVYEVPPTFKQREERHEGSPQKKPCPLDISANDLAKIGHGSASPLGPEAAALATQPGYMFMGRDSPVDSSSGQYEYEVVGPSQSGFEVKGTQSANSQYELLTMSWTQSGGTSQTSLAQSSPVYEIAPTPILAPLEPRPAAPSTISQAPSVYEIAPPPRPYVPARPPPYDVPSTRPPQNNVPPVRPPQNNIPPARLPQNNVPPARPPQNNVPLIEGMDDKEPPPLAPRPHNEYAKFQSTGEPTLRQQGVSSAYEQVRIEAPNGKINVDQAAPPTVPAQTYMGDYCTLDPKAIGSMNPPAITKREDISSSSSFGSASGSDVSEIPPIPPPSPSLAEAAVFAALDTSVKHVPPKTEDESRPKEGDLRRDRPPVPSPRRESLHDRPKWYAEEDGTKAPEHEVAWDPFSNPPNKEETPPVNHNSDENSKNTVFTSLHKRYSVHGSRENLTEESTEQNAKEGGSEDQKQTPLIYENVLFKRSDSAVRSSVTKKPEIQATEMETKPEDKDGSAETKHESYFSSDLSSSLDEEAEWEKIDQLLLSIGEIENIGEQIADAGKATTVPDWLKALGVAQYESDLMTNGFDTLDFLNGGVLEDLDLLEIGVTDVAHRKVILEAAKLLPSPPRVAKLDNPPSTVEEWLKLIKLSEYLEVFLHHGFASMDRVKMLWEVELTSVLEINCLGHRNRILTSLIEPRRMTMVRKSRQTELDSKGNFGLDEKLAELKLFCPDEEPAKVVAALDGDFLNKIADEMINDESLKRKTLEKKKAKQWRHEPEVLLKGSVNYTTQYLGSQTVKEIVGVKSTVDACRKMKLSTAKLQKIPSVTLAVSVNGIKFIDSRTKLVVSNHQMSNVSYITQDPENKRIFAYIAKDAKVNRHYCHVFRVEDLKLSDEITMTIGQAFELAYDQYMQIQTLINPKKS